jgi:hypothetical protein
VFLESQSPYFTNTASAIFIGNVIVTMCHLLKVYFWSGSHKQILNVVLSCEDRSNVA